MQRVFCLMTVLVVSSFLTAAEPLKSGPQVGDELPGPFHPLNVTGINAGEKACLFCRFGGSPVAMVFAREATPEVAKLVKMLDEATVKYREAEMGSCVVFCSDASTLQKKLEELAKKEDIKNVVLAIDNPAGPKEYNVTKAADVTILLYTERTVKANHSFRKGELNDKTIAKVLADLPKILPEKK